MMREANRFWLKIIRFPNTLEELLDIVNNYSESIYYTITTNVMRWSWYANDEMPAKSEIILIGDTNLKTTIMSLRSMLIDNCDSFTKRKYSKLKSALDEAENNIELFQNRIVGFASSKCYLDEEENRKVLEYQTIAHPDITAYIYDNDLPYNRKEFIHIKPSQAYDIVSKAFSCVNYFSAFEGFNAKDHKELNEIDGFSNGSYVHQNVQFWLKIMRFPSTLDDLLSMLKMSKENVYKAILSDIMDYFWIADKGMMTDDIVLFIGENNVSGKIDKCKAELVNTKNSWNDEDYDLLAKGLEVAKRQYYYFQNKVFCLAPIKCSYSKKGEYLLEFPTRLLSNKSEDIANLNVPSDTEEFIRIQYKEALLLASKAFYNPEYLTSFSHYSSQESAAIDEIAFETEFSNYKYEYSKYVQAYVINNSFEKNLDELLEDMKHRGYPLLDDLLSSHFTKWSCPRWCKIGDLSFFMFSKTSIDTIRRLKKEYSRIKEKYSKREQYLIEKGLERGETLYREYGASIFGVGRVSGNNYFEKQLDDNAHWNSPVYAPISEIYFFKKPIHIDEFRSFITISRANSITPVLGGAFNELKKLISSYNDIPEYLEKSVSSPMPLKDVDEITWIDFGKEYRRHFFLEDAFRKYYADYLLSELGDTKTFYRECSCYKSDGNPPRVDNIIRFDGKLLPVEIKLSIEIERDLRRQVKQYCHIKRFNLGNNKVLQNNNGAQFYDENVLIIDTERIYMYTDNTGIIERIYVLDDLNYISQINDIRNCIREKLIMY